MKKRPPLSRRIFYDDDTGDMVVMELMPHPWDGLHKAIWAEVSRTAAPKVDDERKP